MRLCPVAFDSVRQITLTKLYINVFDFHVQSTKLLLSSTVLFMCVAILRNIRLKTG